MPYDDGIDMYYVVCGVVAVVGKKMRLVEPSRARLRMNKGYHTTVVYIEDQRWEIRPLRFLLRYFTRAGRAGLGWSGPELQSSDHRDGHVRPTGISFALNRDRNLVLIRSRVKLILCY